VPDPVQVRELLERHKYRLYVYLQALLPGGRPHKEFRDAGIRVLRHPEPPVPERFVPWAEDIARQVATEHRRTLAALPFSDDLFRQVADSAEPVLAVCERHPSALAEVLGQLPPPERDLLRERYSAGRTVDQIAHVLERKPAAVARDLNALHASLVAALYEARPDTGPPPPGGATDIGRLTIQLVDGTITDDGRLVLETLLLGDAATLTHYHRNVALVAALDWTHGWQPVLPETVPVNHRLTVREWAVTAAFLVAVLAVIAFALLRLYGYL
jgi:DNA-directed RNA polymerase specialized sigma24 family protein